MVGRVFLGRYEAVRVLGEGGMGKVYLARQLDLGRQVVIKVMHDHIASDTKFRDRFLRETLLMARFQHPYAVTLYDASLNDPNGPCIVMEYIRGVNLETLLQKNGRISPERLGRLLCQLCEVLQAAHDEGMVHRDLKPANLMVIDYDTPREKIKVMDFGLAKLVDDHQTASIKKLTETNVEFAVGTPGYISPEQVRGEAVDARSDLYSVGVIMYEMLSGRLPFQGASSMDMMLAHATEKPPSFNSLDMPGIIPKPIERLVLACLAKDPRERPQSARELADRYEDALYQSEGEGVDVALFDTDPNQETVGPVFVEDPTTLTFSLEAWMPETIAILKLRGFVQDFQGEIVESVAGLIRVHLGVKNKRLSGSGMFSLLGLSRRNDELDLELHLHQSAPERTHHLIVYVVFRPSFSSQLHDPTWRDRCTQTFIDLRGYLIAS